MYRGDQQQSAQIRLSSRRRLVHNIAAAGTESARTANDVTTKISAIESSFRAVEGWLVSTVEGLQKETLLLAIVLFKCPYYYDLIEIHGRSTEHWALQLNTDTQWQLDEADQSWSDDHELERARFASEEKIASSTCNHTASSASATIRPAKRHRSESIDLASFARPHASSNSPK